MSRPKRADVSRGSRLTRELMRNKSPVSVRYAETETLPLTPPPIGLLVLDQRLRVRWADSVASELLGTKLQTIHGRALRDFVDRRDRRIVAERLRAPVTRANERALTEQPLTFRGVARDRGVSRVLRILAAGASTPRVHGEAEVEHGVALIDVRAWQDVLALAVDRERQKISLLLHRTVQQSITAADLFCGSLTATLAEQRSPSHADALRVRRQIRQALLELRELKQTLNL